MARFLGQNKVYGNRIFILRDDFQLMTSVDMLPCNGILSLRHDFYLHLLPKLIWEWVPRIHPYFWNLLPHVSTLTYERCTYCSNIMWWWKQIKQFL